MKKNKTIICLSLIVGLSLILRILRIILRNRISKDAVNYIHMARQLAEGNLENAFEFNTRIPPLYSYLMSFLINLGFDPFFVGKYISSVSGALLPVPVFFIAKRILNTKMALLSAFCVAVHPYLIRISGEVMRDSLSMLLIFTSLAFAIYATEEKYKRLWYPAGLFCGLSVMVRSEGIELVLAVFVWIAFELCVLFKNGSLKPKMVLKYCFCVFCFIATYLLVTIPTQLFLVKTPSTWSVIDTRFISYWDSFIKRDSEDIVEQGSK